LRFSFLLVKIAALLTERNILTKVAFFFSIGEDCRIAD